jgi:excinuclease ABC subunit B
VTKTTDLQELTKKRPEGFVSDWELQPMGDQPAAIDRLLKGLTNGVTEQTLLGVTGSGKTFTMANVIAKANRPALVFAHNKTLAAQLFHEFRELFPQNAVEYFISYYDYYQPEAYIPSTDTFIDKVSAINEDIDKMRHRATRSLLERRDVIVVASVSCIYGLGSPKKYLDGLVPIEVGQVRSRDSFIRELIHIQYTRNDVALDRGRFRVRGNVVDLVPAYEKDVAVRIEFLGSRIDRISHIDALTGKQIEILDQTMIYPGSHYVTSREEIDTLVRDINRDLTARLDEFQRAGRLIEAQRLEMRTLNDIDMIREIGYCQGIENYSRYLDGRDPGDPPHTLLDYFPNDYLLFIDESHVTVPQIGGMYRGDRMRKQTLVDFGFRLPSALDNRPLNFEEFCERMGQTIYVSATPGAWERERCGSEIAEQVIRPTGLVDPEIIVKPATGQMDDLLTEISSAVAAGARVLVTTLTKRMAEDVTLYYKDRGISIRYLHSEIDSLQRTEILRDLRRGVFDVLIGINLLREGLDLPEVALVAILDADKEGFLRSRTSLIQTVGRAARNANGRVIMYADKITDSMRGCIEETERRRSKQIAFNKSQGIQPQTIVKKVPEKILKIYNLDSPQETLQTIEEALADKALAKLLKNPAQIEKRIQALTKDMQKLAQALDFESAAARRDEIRRLKNLLLAQAGEEPDTP